jgi:hypothetical protein
MYKIHLPIRSTILEHATAYRYKTDLIYRGVVTMVSPFPSPRIVTTRRYS